MFEDKKRQEKVVTLTVLTAVLFTCHKFVLLIMSLKSRSPSMQLPNDHDTLASTYL